MDFKGRSFLKLSDFEPSEIIALLDLSEEFKLKKKNGISHRFLEGKNIALIFEKNSTRTRCSFEVAAFDLGMHTTFLNPADSQIGKKESIKDTARVLGRLYDAIEYRGYAQETVETLAKYAGVPVFNGLTNEAHPTQVLADLLTIKEHFGDFNGLNFVYMGDARYNMANSLMVGCSKMGLNFTACAPAGYFPDKALTEQCNIFAGNSGCSINLTENAAEAVKNADIIYTDVWVSMGETPLAWEERIKLMLPYQVNGELMAKAKPETVFMHCLPSFHNMETEIGRETCEKYALSALEATDEVFESQNSLVFDEAENRMHTIKALLSAMI